MGKSIIEVLKLIYSFIRFIETAITCKIISIFQAKRVSSLQLIGRKDLILHSHTAIQISKFQLILKLNSYSKYLWQCMFKLVCYLGLSAANVEVPDDFLHDSLHVPLDAPLEVLAAVILAHVIGHGVSNCILIPIQFDMEMSI